MSKRRGKNKEPEEKDKGEAEEKVALTKKKANVKIRKVGYFVNINTLLNVYFTI